MSSILKLCPTHFSRRGAKNFLGGLRPLVAGMRVPIFAYSVVWATPLLVLWILRWWISHWQYRVWRLPLHPWIKAVNQAGKAASTTLFMWTDRKLNPIHYHKGLVLYPTHLWACSVNNIQELFKPYHAHIVELVCQTYCLTYKLSAIEFGKKFNKGFGWT